jgi:hypothetical protein
MAAEQSRKNFEATGKHFNNKENAKLVVTEIEGNMEHRIAQQTDKLATQQDILALEAKIAESKFDVIKWAFSFFVALALMIIGLYVKK